MRIDRCTVCATTIYDGDDEVCRHGWRTCLACDARDACEECQGEWLASRGIEPTNGMCTACGAVEVRLIQATGTRDLSGIGESARYPTGYGCEACA